MRFVVLPVYNCETLNRKSLLLITKLRKRISINNILMIVSKRNSRFRITRIFHCCPRIKNPNRLTERKTHKSKAGNLISRHRQCLKRRVMAMTQTRIFSPIAGVILRVQFPCSNQSRATIVVRLRALLRSCIKASSISLRRRDWSRPTQQPDWST